MAVYVSNITIPAGEDFEQTFTLENAVNNSSFDLNNYTAKSHLKKHPASLNTTAIFNVSFPNRQAGEILLSLGSTITSTLKPGRYSYDIIINDGSKNKRVVEGSALVTAGVTT
jgi:hypothetical protein